MTNRREFLARTAQYAAALALAPLALAPPRDTGAWMLRLADALDRLADDYEAHPRGPIRRGLATR